MGTGRLELAYDDKAQRAVLLLDANLLAARAEGRDGVEWSRSSTART